MPRKTGSRPVRLKIEDGCTYAPDSRLFVLACGRGFSALGLDRARAWSRAVRAWAGAPSAPDRTPRQAWESYREALRLGEERHAATGERCPCGLSPALAGLEGHRVEVRTPGERPRRFVVRKSSGWCPVHLEAARRSSSGGFPAYVPEGSKVEVVG